MGFCCWCWGSLELCFVDVSGVSSGLGKVRLSTEEIMDSTT